MSDGKWVCQDCGEKNILERMNCYSCLAFKPGPRTPPGPIPLTPPDPPPRDDQTNGVPRKNWNCKFCNAANSPGAKECYLCNSVRPKKTCYPEGWVCRFCTTENRAREENCSTCHAIRDASVSTPTTPSDTGNNNTNTNNNNDINTVNNNVNSDTGPDHSVEYWVCSTCSYRASHGPHCFHCGAPKNPSIKPCPGNWQCSKCSKTNFAKREQCYNCNKKQRKRSPSLLPITCTTCKFCNEPSSKDCLLCGTPLPLTAPIVKPPSQKRRMLKTSSSSGTNQQGSSSSSNNNHRTTPPPLETPKNLFITPKDWKCQSCDYKNIALRNFCKDCDTPRKCIAKLYIKYKKYGLSALCRTPESQQDASTPDTPSSCPRTPTKLLSGCSRCGKPHEGTNNLCADCVHKLRPPDPGDSVRKLRPDPGECTRKLRPDPGDSARKLGRDSGSGESLSVIVKNCSKCGASCDGQYCYNCAHKLGIRQEVETWECQNCHLVDENTAICMGCGHNKAESATIATKYITCNSCKTKNHPHKDNCVRCLKVLAKKATPMTTQRPSTPDTWTCMFCEISVLAQSTHCRGCARPRARAAKESSGEVRESVEREEGERVEEEEEEEEGEYVEEEEQLHSANNQETGEYVERHFEAEPHDQEYYEEEYYTPSHFIPPPRARPRFPPPGPPRLPPPPPHFSQGARFTNMHPLLPHRPPRHPHVRLRGPPPHRPRNTAPKKILLSRRQPMNLMMQHNKGH